MSDLKGPIPLYLFTYNCNKQSIIPDLLGSKILDSFPKELSQVYAFGLQEFCTTLDGCFASQANRELIKYNELFLRALNQKYAVEGAKFQTIAINHTGAIGLIIICPFPSKIQRIRIARAGCGYGKSSLKGGVGVRFSFQPGGKHSHRDHVELSFACVHLSAFEGEFYYNKRNQDLENIIRSLDFGDGFGLFKRGNHTFIFGDMNYRTTQKYQPLSLEAKRLFSLHDQSQIIQEMPYLLNLEYDELTKGMKNGEVLLGFSEARIDFQPTYKFYRFTAIYNDKRCPSWCDRIVYQSSYNPIHSEDGEESHLLRLRKDAVQMKKYWIPSVAKYDCIDSLKTSDHRPVYLDISVPFEPPEPIISPSGYLQILALDESEIISGPTQTYLKPTKYDFFIQNIIRPLSDFTIGYSLWFSTTANGRLMLLAVVLALWFVKYIS
ncbi:Phosphatidylinositol 45-bisphosphate 5-phosphatase INP54 [Spathaspora sp. JA1]|nr:Phosphatidylinositol 45-bisphosphate 5-phosphatase INP54 [Spathaspora sp. JA1]